MRSIATIGLLGLLISGVQAQSLSEHAAAAAGAAIGTAAGKPMSNAITKIFGQVDNDAQKAAGTKANVKPQPKPEPTPTTTPSAPPPPSLGIAPSGSSSSSPAPMSAHVSTGRTRRGSRTVDPNGEAIVVSIPVVAEPPRKEPTAEELASVKVGATTNEVLSVLGLPESRVTIPDEGHLVEICQYWAKGKQLGTVRIDNGQVVTVEKN